MHVLSITQTFLSIPVFVTECSSAGSKQKFAEQVQNEVQQMVYKLASGGTW